MSVVTQVSDVRVSRKEFVRSSLQTAKHCVVRFLVENLSEVDPTARFSASEIGMNRVTFLQAVVPGEHTSAVWGGEQKNVTIRFDGWPGKRFEVVCSVWGN